MKYLLFACLVALSGCANPAQGPQGIPGPTGAQGLIGATGSAGAKGDQGAPGANGSSCSVTAVPASNVAPNGGSLIQCTDGSQSLVLNGTNGVDGQNGHDGANGQDGSPGTLVRSVKFCTDEPSYPTTFPEVGFCIDNQLYAVYSANGGFLTRLEPGTWASNAVGSSCIFTVGANCQVSN